MKWPGAPGRACPASDQTKRTRFSELGKVGSPVPQSSWQVGEHGQQWQQARPSLCSETDAGDWQVLLWLFPAMWIHPHGVMPPAAQH